MAYLQEFHVFHNKSSVDLYPVQFGRESCKSLQAFGPTTVNGYLFHYILEDNGTFYLNEENHSTQLIAGQGFLIPPHTICSYQADLNTPWTYAWIEFNGLKAKHYLKSAGLSRQNLIYYPKKPNVHPEIKTSLMTIIENSIKADTFLIGHLYLFLEQLAINSRYYSPDSRHDIQNFYIRETIQYIHDHYNEALSVELLADHCNLNRSHFSRLFKKELSLSPSQFILQYRLKMASELLSTTSASIQDIAESVGFTNSFNFSTSFKKFFGVNPSKWRHQET